MKYAPLRDHLATRWSEVTMTFDEVAELVGGLPSSAFTHAAWWSNEQDGNHVQARAWMGAGFEASADLTKRRVRFSPVNGGPPSHS